MAAQGEVAGCQALARLKVLLRRHRAQRIWIPVPRVSGSRKPGQDQAAGYNSSCDMDCTPDTLANDARCLESCIPTGMYGPLLISIFCRIAKMNCDPETLIQNALCLEACLPVGMQMPVLINLACQILNGGGALGKEIFSGNGDPNGVITPNVTDALYRQMDSVPIGLIWTWRGSGPWIAPTP